MPKHVALASLTYGKDAETVPARAMLADGYGAETATLAFTCSWAKASPIPRIDVGAREAAHDEQGFERLHTAACLLAVAGWMDDAAVFNDLIGRPEPHWQALRAAIRTSCPPWKALQFKEEAKIGRAAAGHAATGAARAAGEAAE